MRLLYDFLINVNLNFCVLFIVLKFIKKLPIFCIKILLLFFELFFKNFSPKCTFKFNRSQFILQKCNSFFITVFFFNKYFLYFTRNAKFHSCLVKLFHQQLISVLFKLKFFRKFIILIQINSSFII